MVLAEVFGITLDQLVFPVEESEDPGRPEEAETPAEELDRRLDESWLARLRENRHAQQDVRERLRALRAEEAHLIANLSPANRWPEDPEAAVEIAREQEND